MDNKNTIEIHSFLIKDNLIYTLLTVYFLVFLILFICVINYKLIKNSIHNFIKPKKEILPVYYKNNHLYNKYEYASLNQNEFKKNLNKLKEEKKFCIKDCSCKDEKNFKSNFLLNFFRKIFCYKEKKILYNKFENSSSSELTDSNEPLNLKKNDKKHYTYEKFIEDKFTKTSLKCYKNKENSSEETKKITENALEKATILSPKQLKNYKPFDIKMASPIIQPKLFGKDTKNLDQNILSKSTFFEPKIEDKAEKFLVKKSLKNLIEKNLEEKNLEKNNSKENNSEGNNLKENNLKENNSEKNNSEENKLSKKDSIDQKKIDFEKNKIYSLSKRILLEVEIMKKEENNLKKQQIALHSEHNQIIDKQNDQQNKLNLIIKIVNNLNEMLKENIKKNENWKLQYLDEKKFNEKNMNFNSINEENSSFLVKMKNKLKTNMEKQIKPLQSMYTIINSNDLNENFTDENSAKLTLIPKILTENKNEKLEKKKNDHFDEEKFDPMAKTKLLKKEISYLPKTINNYSDKQLNEKNKSLVKLNEKENKDLNQNLKRLNLDQIEMKNNDFIQKKNENSINLNISKIMENKLEKKNLLKPYLVKKSKSVNLEPKRFLGKKIFKNEEKVDKDLEKLFNSKFKFNE